MAEDRYEQLHAAFRWQVPPDFNIAEACCGRWARDTPNATAIYFDSESGCRAHYSYGQLQRAANRLSMALVIAALIIGSSIVMNVQGGPTIFGLPVLGFLGFVGAVLGGIWLLGSIWRTSRQDKED